MHRIYIIILILFFCSCTENNTNSEEKIEFFLTKNRLESSIGEKLPNVYSPKDLEKLKSTKVINIEITKIDNTNGNLIVAGPFKTQKSDLQAKPLITDKEIIKFDLKTNTFIFSPKATKRINELEIDNVHGKQFVITIDGKSKLTGYFWTISLSSYGICHTNHIYNNYDEFKLESGLNKDKIVLSKDFPEIYKVLKRKEKLK